MRVFLDTNILVDFVTERADYKPAAAILSLGQNKDMELFASFLSLANIAYILRKLPLAEVRRILRILQDRIEILSMEKHQLSKAIESDASDIEDAIQYFCALDGKCDVLITRNVKHFNFSGISVVTPQEFLNNWETGNW